MSEKIIDWALADQLVQGDHPFAVEMVRALIECIPEFQRDLKSAFESNNFDNLKKVAHKLYGATCYTGTTRLKTAAKLMELEDKNIPAAYDRLVIELDAVYQLKEEPSSFWG